MRVVTRLSETKSRIALAARTSDFAPLNPGYLLLLNRGDSPSTPQGPPPPAVQTPSPSTPAAACP
jgi:hypothetical protein